MATVAPTGQFAKYGADPCPWPAAQHLPYTQMMQLFGRSTSIDFRHSIAHGAQPFVQGIFARDQHLDQTSSRLHEVTPFRRQISIRHADLVLPVLAIVDQRPLDAIETTQG